MISVSRIPKPFLIEFITASNTKARRREVTELTRSGLRDALEALERRMDVVGTSGYSVREDVVLATTSSDAEKLVKGA